MEARRPADGGKGMTETPLRQDVDGWVRELRAAGWVPVSVRTLKEVPGSTTWLAPHGSLYRGPFRAWTVMRYHTCIRQHPRTCTCGMDAFKRDESDPT